MRRSLIALALVALIGTACEPGSSSTLPIPPPPTTTQPEVQIFVSPTGSDADDGASRATPLQTVRAAWALVPAVLTAPVRINLLPGSYPLPANGLSLFDKRGTASSPLTIDAVDGRDTVTLAGGASFGRVSHLRIEDVNFEARVGEPVQSNNVVQVQASDHVTISRSRMIGPDITNPGSYVTQEVLKVNQSTDFAVVDSEITGSFQTGLDFVAVHGAQVLRNRMHGTGQWCGYVKGGSANIVVSGNEMYDCAVGGFAAGEGSGHEFHVLPYVTYETYGVQIVNNVFRDLQGHGVGVQGGYNTLIAHNTFRNVGLNARGYGLAVVSAGSRGCNEQAVCDRYVAAGGWSNAVGAADQAAIPNKHTWIYNNVFLNDGVSTQYDTFAIYGPQAQPASARNVPNPAVSDDDLRFVGNVVWNEGRGLGANVDAAAFLATNTFNTLRPQLDAELRPIPRGTVFDAPTTPIPDFSWTDAPPGVPLGLVETTPPTDWRGAARDPARPVAGAFVA
jgi:hypothetical protein